MLSTKNKNYMNSVSQHSAVASSQAQSPNPHPVLALPQVRAIRDGSHEPEVNHRRKGKIARLPKAARERVNQMIAEGLPYSLIILQLGELGKGLNAQNLVNWKRGGYRDWERHHDRLLGVRIQMEVAAEFLKETGEMDQNQILDACNKLASLQLFGALQSDGTDCLNTMFARNPGKFFRVVNAVCNSANTALNFEKRAARLQPSVVSPSSASSQIKVNQA
jgi:hypothetical protein